VSRRWIALLLAATLPGIAGAAPTAVPAAPAAPARMPTEVVDAYREAVKRGDRAGVVAELAADLVIYEQGFEEHGRDAYVEHALGNDLTFASMVQREQLGREAWEDGNVAWVLVRSVDRGDFDGRKLELENTETLLLRRTDAGWKIVHIHRSAHPREAAADTPVAAPAAPAP
jgi:ketosteroid isomerase-like protein